MSHLAPVVFVNSAPEVPKTPKVPKYKLTYFDLPLLAEPIRTTFKIGGIEFEDHRIPFPEFQELKPTFAFGSVPVLAVKTNDENEDVVFSQSGAILLYAGKMTGLYPECPIEAMKVDEALGGLDDLFQEFSKHKAAAEGSSQLMDEGIPRYAGGLDKLYANTSGPFLLGDKISIADCKLDMIFRALDVFKLPHCALDKYTHLKAARKAIESKLTKHRNFLI